MGCEVGDLSTDSFGTNRGSGRLGWFRTARRDAEAEHRCGGGDHAHGPGRGVRREREGSRGSPRWASWLLRSSSTSSIGSRNRPSSCLRPDPHRGRHGQTVLLSPELLGASPPLPSTTSSSATSYPHAACGARHRRLASHGGDRHSDAARPTHHRRPTAHAVAVGLQPLTEHAIRPRVPALLPNTTDADTRPSPVRAGILDVCAVCQQDGWRADGGEHAGRVSRR